MLALAESGGYPQAARPGQYRDDEIAYWRLRLAQDVAALAAEDPTDARTVIQ